MTDFTQEEIDKLNEEWQQILDRFPHTEPFKRRRAVRWVLVHAFGTKEQFLFDPMFHARVTQAENMLMLLADSLRTGKGDTYAIGR